MAKYSVAGLNGQFDFVTLAGDSSLTFEPNVARGSALAGAPVKITGILQAGLADSGDEVYGQLERIESDGTVVVGKGGVQAFRIGETAPTAGSAIVAGAENTVADATAPAGKGVVLDVDETNGIAYVDLG